MKVKMIQKQVTGKAGFDISYIDNFDFNAKITWSVSKIWKFLIRQRQIKGILKTINFKPDLYPAGIFFINSGLSHDFSSSIKAYGPYVYFLSCVKIKEIKTW